MFHPFEAGMQARVAGKDCDEFPDECLARVTKLGTRVPNEDGEKWLAGWHSVKRIASRGEVDAANRLTDLSQFRSRHRRER